MSRYPYERFLRFLVSRKVDVNATLSRHELPSVGGIWLAECRTQIRDHAPFALASYIDSTDEDLNARDGVLEWAEKEGFRSLWAMQREFDNCDPPPAYDLAYQMFANMHTRALLGCLLLSRATEEEQITLMRDQFGIELDPVTLSAYRHLWWDTGSVPRKWWNGYIEKLKNKEERSYIAFGLTSPSAQDIRDMLGLETNVDDDRVLDSIVSHAYTQFRTAMNQPQPEAAGAMRWAELALNAIRTRRSGGAGKPDPNENAPKLHDFHNMFSVQPTKSHHVTLAQLHGKVAHRDDQNKKADPK